MPVIRWTISDGVTTDTFAMNPNAGGSPQYKKSFREQSTLAPGSAALVFEGQQPIKTGSVTGTILTAAQYAQYVTWFKKSVPLTLTDDLGRVMSIVITEFLPERVYSGSNFFRHTFTLNYLILTVTDL